MSDHFNLPNSITWLRIALIPMFVVVFFTPAPWAGPVAAAIFALAGITDWLDGYLARRMQLLSPFGEFLDPVADKLMVSTALVLLVAEAQEYQMAVALSAAIIIGREITVSALREWMAKIGEHGRVKVSWVGKSKTLVQIVAIMLMLYRIPLAGLATYDLGMLLLVFAAGLTLWSMFRYIRAAWPVLRGEIRA